MSFLMQQLDTNSIQLAREKKTTAALNEAKLALIGSAISSEEITTPASAAAPRLFPQYLPNPDLRLSSALPEGSESGIAGARDISLIGKFPWYSLNVQPIKDGWQECLWYIVSGRFKHSPSTLVLNWDTQGQLDIVDHHGQLVASNLIAIVASVGSILADQNRTSNANLPNCGGNYDVKNYLDTPNIANAIQNVVNYFSGSTNNRQASNTNNKQFVLTKNEFYNDQFAYISSEDIFRPLMFRSDFKNQINQLLNENQLSTILLSGSKGTNNINCSIITSKTNQIFCNNWKEMLLIKDFTPAVSVKLLDTSTNFICNRVVIFGGKKIDSQSRLTILDKNNPDNYLENENLTAYKTQTPPADFKGFSTFDPNNPSADVIKCL